MEVIYSSLMICILLKIFVLFYNLTIHDGNIKTINNNKTVQNHINENYFISENVIVIFMDALDSKNTLLYIYVDPKLPLNKHDILLNILLVLKFMFPIYL